MAFQFVETSRQTTMGWLIDPVLGDHLWGLAPDTATFPTGGQTLDDSDAYLGANWETVDPISGGGGIPVASGVGWIDNYSDIDVSANNIDDAPNSDIVITVRPIQFTQAAQGTSTLSGFILGDSNDASDVDDVYLQSDKNFADITLSSTGSSLLLEHTIYIESIS